MFVEELSKGLSRWVCYTLYHCIQCHLGSADGSHAMMYAPRSEAPLNDLLESENKARKARLSNSDLEPSAPAKYQVSQRHTDIVVDDLRVTLGRVIVPHDHHMTNNLDARSISRDDHDALLLIRVGVIWVTLP